MTRKFVCVTKSNAMVFPHLSAVIFLFRLTRVSRPIVTGPGSGIRALGHRIIEIEEIRMLYHCGGNSPTICYNSKPFLAAWLLIFCTPECVANDKPDTLPAMVVTAHLVPGRLDQTGSAVTVITAEQIEQQKVIYVSDILRTVPGLAVNRQGSFGSFTQVRIRGAEGNQTLVRLDGIEVNDPSGGSEYDFGNLLAADIERIEILRGPQSALYGSDGIGGVINIISKRGKKGLRPTFIAEGGSFDTYRVGGGLSGGTGDRFDFSGGADYFSSEGISSADADNGNGERDANRNLTAYVNSNFRPLDNLEFGLTGRLIHNQQDLDDFGTVAFDANDSTKGEHYYGRIFGQLNLFEETGWINWEHIGSAGYSENQRDNFGSFQSEFDGKRSQYYYQTNLLIDTPDLAESHHTLTFKLEHERDTVNASSAFSNVDRSVGTTSYIGEYQLAMLERLSLSGSVRYDNNDNLFDDQTTYRTTFSYLLKETGSRLHASWGTGV
ncbi:MAG: TonB-dependent receptor plug domain-containing protein, partial [Methylococcaceae bacterium]|nr:TonB-dependent receptor plug domain-containing protein [Methylococcaceae bacterium]